MQVTIHVWRTEDRLCDSVSPPTLWFPGIELRLSGLATSSFSHRATLLPSNIHCKKKVKSCCTEKNINTHMHVYKQGIICLQGIFLNLSH